MFTWSKNPRHLQFLSTSRFRYLFFLTGEDDLCNASLPCEVSAEEIARRMGKIADILKDKAEKDFVVGIAPRHNQRERTSALVWSANSCQSKICRVL